MALGPRHGRPPSLTGVDLELVSQGRAEAKQIHHTLVLSLEEGGPEVTLQSSWRDNGSAVFNVMGDDRRDAIVVGLDGRRFELENIGALTSSAFRTMPRSLAPKALTLSPERLGAIFVKGHVVVFAFQNAWGGYFIQYAIYRLVSRQLAFDLDSSRVLVGDAAREMLAELARIESEVVEPDADGMHNNPPDRVDVDDLVAARDALDDVRTEVQQRTPRHEHLTAALAKLLRFGGKLAAWVGSKLDRMANAAADEAGKRLVQVAAAGAVAFVLAWVAKLTGLASTIDVLVRGLGG